MSRLNNLAPGLAVSLIGLIATSAVADFGFGRPASTGEVAGWNIDVRPDGEGLPPGHGSVQEGQAIYDDKCASCHGTFGESGDYMQLAGGVGSLASAQPVRTMGSKLNYATTLFDYINRAMPFPTPKTLTANEVYALTAYVLNLNDILPADASLDQNSLPRVKMPNRDGFTRDHGLGSVHGKSDTHNLACMHGCEKNVSVVSQLPPDFTQQTFGDISEAFRGLATMNEGGRPKWLEVAAAGGITAGAAAPAPSKGYALAQQFTCTACHAPDRKIVGPAFRDVAEKYKGDASAPGRLQAKVREGGSGAWGGVPMPSQPQVGDDDLKIILAWVLSGAPTP